MSTPPNNGPFVPADGNVHTIDGRPVIGGWASNQEPSTAPRPSLGDILWNNPITRTAMAATAALAGEIVQAWQNHNMSVGEPVQAYYAKNQKQFARDIRNNTMIPVDTIQKIDVRKAHQYNLIHPTVAPILLAENHQNHMLASIQKMGQARFEAHKQQLAQTIQRELNRPHEGLHGTILQATHNVLDHVDQLKDKSFQLGQRYTGAQILSQSQAVKALAFDIPNMDWADEFADKYYGIPKNSLEAQIYKTNGYVNGVATGFVIPVENLLQADYRGAQILNRIPGALKVANGLARATELYQHLPPTLRGPLQNAAADAFSGYFFENPEGVDPADLNAQHEARMANARTRAVISLGASGFGKLGQSLQNIFDSHPALKARISHNLPFGPAARHADDMGGGFGGKAKGEGQVPSGAKPHDVPAFARTKPHPNPKMNALGIEIPDKDFIPKGPVKGNNPYTDVKTTAQFPEGYDIPKKYRISENAQHYSPSKGIWWMATGKVEGQMQETKRNWTKEMVGDTLDNPYRVAKTIDRREDPYTGVVLLQEATVFYRPDFHYVVRNDITGEILQVSKITDPNWKDDFTGITLTELQNMDKLF